MEAKISGPLVSALALLGGLAACTLPVQPEVDSVVEVYDDTYADSPPCRVEVIWREPKVKYRQLAVIDVTGEENVPYQRLAEEMKIRAREVGADAVLTTTHPGSREYATIISRAGNDWQVSSVQPRLLGVAIKYLEGPPCEPM